MKNISNFQKGLTLIELMIVVVIIATLSALVIGNLFIMPRIRDAQRKADLRMIQHAIEQYKIDLDQYPPSNTSEPGCSYIKENCFFSSALGDLNCEKVYLSNIPKDPTGSINCGNYYYEINDNKTIYSLAACLENASDSDSNVVQANILPNFGCNTTKIYLLTNNPNL